MESISVVSSGVIFTKTLGGSTRPATVPISTLEPHQPADTLAKFILKRFFHFLLGF